MEVFLKNIEAGIILFSGPVLKMENELYTVRLMPTVEAAESLWDMSACISRGIKENMQR